MGASANHHLCFITLFFGHFSRYDSYGEERIGERIGNCRAYSRGGVALESFHNVCFHNIPGRGTTLLFVTSQSKNNWIKKNETTFPHENEYVVKRSCPYNVYMER